MSLKLLSIFAILLVRAYGNVLPEKTTLSDNISTTINFEDLLKKFGEEKDDQKKFQMFQQLLDEKRELLDEKQELLDEKQELLDEKQGLLDEKQELADEKRELANGKQIAEQRALNADRKLYSVTCLSNYRLEVWYMEGEYMTEEFIRRHEWIKKVEEELISKHISIIFESDDSPFPKIRSYYRSASKKQQDEARQRFAGMMVHLYGTRREFQWELFLTWLLTTSEWRNKTFGVALVNLEVALTNTLKLGFTIFDFIICILKHFKLASDRVKNIAGNKLLKYYKAKEELKEIYEQIMMVQEYKNQKTIKMKKKQFFVHYCAEILQRTVWESEHVKRWKLQTKESPGKMRPQIGYTKDGDDDHDDYDYDDDDYDDDDYDNDDDDYDDDDRTFMPYPQVIRKHLQQYNTKKSSEPIKKSKTKSRNQITKPMTES